MSITESPYDQSYPPSLWTTEPEPEPAPPAPPEPEPEPELPEGVALFTVAEVQQHVADNPDDAQACYDAEQAGLHRTTLLSWLLANGASDEGPPQ